LGLGIKETLLDYSVSKA
jgi:hypothetical protein